MTTLTYELTEAWLKPEGEDCNFVFCSEKDGFAGCTLELSIGTDGDSWSINAIEVIELGYGVNLKKIPLTGARLAQAVTFYSEHLYQQLQYFVAAEYVTEDDERAVNKWKEEHA